MAVTLQALSALLDLGSVRLPLDPADVFGAPMELEVELGTGNGRFITARAAERPDLAFLGVERCSKYLRLAAARVARGGVGNVRLVRTTAEDLLFRCLADASVRAVHVFFPDPWPKKRHHKRRLISSANVARIAEVLAPGGLLRIKTDHEPYAALVADVLSAEPRLAALAADEAFASIPPTQYELKYEREGREVHRFALQRV